MQVVKCAPFGVSTTPVTIVRLSSIVWIAASTVIPAVSMICSVETKASFAAMQNRSSK